MSHLGPAVVDDLHAIADEVREVLSERGYKVDVVRAMDPAFSVNGRVASELLRALVADGIAIGASRVGHYFDRPRGAVEVTISTGLTQCIFRLRRATRRRDGSYSIPNNNSSSWGTLDDDTLEIFEHWVIGFTVDDHGRLDELFAAEVLGREGGLPGFLRLSEPILLGSGWAPPGPRGFIPADEGLPGFGDEDGDEGEGFEFGAEAG